MDTMNHSGTATRRAEQNRSSRCERYGTQRAAVLSCVAYIADPVVIDGAAVLFGQKRAIDRYAQVQGLAIERYLVDSGCPATPEAIGHRLKHLIDVVRGGGESIVVVEHISRLASDYGAALCIAAALSSWGVAVHEARGGLANVDRALASRLFGEAVDRACGPRLRERLPRVIATMGRGLSGSGSRR